MQALIQGKLLCQKGFIYPQNQKKRPNTGFNKSALKSFLTGKNPISGGTTENPLYSGHSTHCFSLFLRLQNNKYQWPESFNSEKLYGKQ